MSVRVQRRENMILGFILLILPVMGVICLALYLPFYVHIRRKDGKRGFFYHLVRYMLLGYVVSLLYLTIFWSFFPDIPHFSEYHLLNLVPFVWVTNTYEMGWKNMIEQLLLNIAMFVPYGILLPIVSDKMERFLKTAGVVFATTLTIEIVQYFIGRSADIDDVIMNLLGGIIGYLLYCVMRRIFGEREWWRIMKYGGRTLV